MELLPALVARTFTSSAMGLAWCSSAIGAGAMIAGLVFTVTPVSTAHLPRWALTCAAAIGIATCALSFAESQLVILGVVFCLGAVTTFAAIASQTALQSEVSSKLRGRVASIWVMISLGGTAAAGFVFGVIADAVGLSFMLAATGVACTLFAVILGRPARQ